MSNIALTIGGRSFTVACADGEEAHVAGLGRMIHDKVAAMGDGAQQGESRMLLFAALLLADEVSDLRESAVVAAPAPPVAAPESASGTVTDIAARLDAIARQMENLADRLEG